ELPPGEDERHREDDRAVEEDPADERERDDALETLGIEALTRLLGFLADRLEAGHEVRDDLQDEQDREDRAPRPGPGEERGEALRAAGQEPGAGERGEEDQEPEGQTFWKIPEMRIPTVLTAATRPVSSRPAQSRGAVMVFPATA